MRSFLFSIRLSIVFSALGFAHPSDLSPFIVASDGLETVSPNNDTSPQPPTEDGSEGLFKRQNCAANYYYCSTIVTTAICCSTDAICSQDNAGNAACCPLGAFCTGNVAPAAASVAIATTTTNFLTSSIAGGAPIITTATNTIPITTVAATAFTTALPSYVSNVYNFPFPYIATTFANSAACDAAYSSCAAEYALCTSDLQGGAGYGVTISVAGGGGTTVAGPTTGPSLGVAAASSVCAGLSNVACPGIAGGCAVFGTAAAVTATGAGGTTGGGAGSGAGRRGGDGSRGLWVACGVSVIMGVVGWVL